MARIETIEAPEGKAAELLDAVQGKLGLVPNIFKTMAQSSAVLEGFLGLSAALSEGALSAPLKEQIALAVAGYNQCGYCKAAHSMLAQFAGVSDIEESLQAKASDPKEQAALSFAIAMLEKKGHVDDKDVQNLRDAEYSDEEIVEITAHVCINIFTNYFNEVCQPDIDFPVF